MKTSTVAGLACLFVMATGQAVAQTASDSFTVSATVVASCSITANDLDFGDYEVTSATDTDKTTTLDITCTNGTTYTVSLDDGTGSGATTAARVMTKGTDTLTYSLYQTSARDSVWGSNSGTDTVGGTGTGSAQTLTVYGRIPAQQNVATGAYSDTIQATVNF